MRRYPAGSVVLAGFSQGTGLAMAAAAAECAWSPVLGGGVVQPFFSSLGVDLRSTVVIIEAVYIMNDCTFAVRGSDTDQSRRLN